MPLHVFIFSALTLLLQAGLSLPAAHAAPGAWVDAAAHVAAPLEADVRFQLPDRDLYAGVPFRVYVRVLNASEYSAPTVPEIPGATVRIQVLESGESQVITNGRTTRTTSVTYGIDITPEQPGRLELPAITVHADGKDTRTKPTTLDIKKSESGDVFDAEIFGTPPEVFIGQPLELVLRIGIKPYRDPVFGQLNEVQMWQLMDMEGSQWGVFLPTLQRMSQSGGEIPTVQSEQRDGTTWYVYEISRTIWPPKSGAPDVGNVAVRLKYPLGLREVRGFFGNGRQLTLTDSRPVSTVARVHPLTVLPLPEEGRPAGFSGAVGQYTVSASAKPLDVAAGDPITLTLTVTDRTTGDTNLDTLQPPALSELAELKRDFRFPSEPLSGTVSGRAKSFVQTLRPQRADVTAIPAIPFSYFDPTARAYRTVATNAIPLTVRPASQMDLSRIERASGSERPASGNPTTQLTEVERGLMANKPVTPQILASEHLQLSAPLLLALAAPPAVVGGAALWRVHRRRHERDSGLARRSRARRTAQRRLEAAADAAAIGRAVSGFVEDRLGRAEGTMTRGDLQAALNAHGVSTDQRAAVVALLSECDRASYAGAASGEIGALRTRAAAALDALEGVNWARRNGGSA